MDTKRKRRIIIWVSVLTLLGVGGYVAYKFVKDFRDKNKPLDNANIPANPNVQTPTPSSDSTPSQNFETSAPLYPDDVKKFQDWLDRYKPNWVGATNFMLNNGKSLNKGAGYGNFGKSTKKAYEAFGRQWIAFLKNPSADSVVSSWGRPF